MELDLMKIEGAALAQFCVSSKIAIQKYQNWFPFFFFFKLVLTYLDKVALLYKLPTASFRI